MSLIAIIADTHFGVSNSNNLFLEYQQKYFSNLVANLTRLGVTDLFHAGDLYDVRKSIDFKTLRQSSVFFRDRMIEAPFNIHIVVGNHDSYNKNSLAINAPRELLDWTDFNIYDEPTEVEIDGCKIALMPWICRENSERSFDLIENTFADVCIGHFDIAGFSMSRGLVNRAGISRSVFRKFKRTFSGHFHLPSEQDNIIYVGSPYQTTWTDFGDTKRVILYDTKTDSMSYLSNDLDIFQKIHYTEGMTIKDVDVCTNKIVKLYADHHADEYKFDLFVKALNSQLPHKLTIIDSIDHYESENSEDVNMQRDTMEFLVDFINNDPEMSDNDKDDVKALMLTLYTKAQEMR